MTEDVGTTTQTIYKAVARTRPIITTSVATTVHVTATGKVTGWHTGHWRCRVARAIFAVSRRVDRVADRIDNPMRHMT